MLRLYNTHVRDRIQILPVSINSRVSGSDWREGDSLTAPLASHWGHVSTIVSCLAQAWVSWPLLTRPDQPPSVQTQADSWKWQYWKKTSLTKRALFFRNLFNNLFIVWQILRELLFVPDIIFLFLSIIKYFCFHFVIIWWRMLITGPYPLNSHITLV